MNPGPFGMAQTAIPFGEIGAVRDWMGIETEIGLPENEHPKRPITGFACPRSEVSGRRLWGLFSERFQSAADFFNDHFVVNYCPLVFMEETGRNRTPDKLPRSERAIVYQACDAYLKEIVCLLRPAWIVGVGDFAMARAKQTLGENGTAATPTKIGKILHPSPASPWRTAAGDLRRRSNSKSLESGAKQGRGTLAERPRRLEAPDIGHVVEQFLGLCPIALQRFAGALGPCRNDLFQLVTIGRQAMVEFVKKSIIFLH